MRLLAASLLALAVVAAAAPADAQPRPRAHSITGIWQWRAPGNRAAGRLVLIQDGPEVRGAFLDNAWGGGDLEGSFDGRRLALRRAGRDREWVVSIDPSGTRMWGDLQGDRLFPAARASTWEVPPPPPQPPAPPPAPVIRPIDEPSFAQLLAAIGRESFSENRMSVVTQAVGYHWFLVDQVARILPLFTFEDSRLQALERLRPRILDPQNGFKLADLFSYSSSRQRVQQIMAPQR